MNLEELPDPDEKYTLIECIGGGVFAKVWRATNNEAEGRNVAIKIQTLNKDNKEFILEELQTLTDLSSHANLPDFFGAYRKVQDEREEIWFVMELCEGGNMIDLVRGMQAVNRNMSEEHIAFILKEVVKAVIYLHEHHVMHRDIRCSNILLTKEGEVKLVDFGLAKHLKGTLGKTDSILGSPCWMPPEVVDPNYVEDGYGNRGDVWALGITAIEMADGKAPFQDMHPTRAMFQIVRNPPPTLYRPSNWSDNFNDFVNECLLKNPEYRPYMLEVLEHPFLTEVPENNYHLCQEIKSLLDLSMSNDQGTSSEVVVSSKFLIRNEAEPERMHVEDLAGIETLSEDTILHELQARMEKNQFQTFVGDVLLILNPNEDHDIYGPKHQRKYKFKSRSENQPHIFAVADGAYQDALHHMIPQNIILAGESGSGKTTNFLHIIDQLLYLGKNSNINEGRIRKALDLIHRFTHALTPCNDHSTRCVIKADIHFGRTGKVSGAIFDVNQIEKWRVSSTDMSNSNYEILYIFYDGISASGQLEKYSLEEGRSYRYLRIPEESKSSSPRDNPEDNVQIYEEIMEILRDYGISDEDIETIHEVVCAIMVLGDVKFKEGDDGHAEIDNLECAEKVAALLKIDEKKFCWALTNYCLVQKSMAVRKNHTSDEARDARDVLANTIFSRLLDYIVKVINHRLSFGRAIFGEVYSVSVLDIFGFECFKENHLPQLLINCLNEQLHYHYLQRVFGWEALEMNEEDVPYEPIHYYNNKDTLDQILSKPEGLFYLIDYASKMGHGGEYILDFLKKQEKDHVKVEEDMQFSIAHYTGKVTYNSKEMPDRNRDFLPPEVIEVLRLSDSKIVKTFFANKLNRTGNLSFSFDESVGKTKRKHKFSSSDEDKSPTEQEFSQIKKMRTAVSIYKSLSLDILKELSVGGGSGGTHFVRCIRSNLQNTPKGFHLEVVRQQLRAMAILETAKARQRGYPHRISFPEFLRRYQFLAFDFNENVEVTKENCRLLLIRLQMEGWVIGKNKVLLKYYNEEYLARLYETQVKKVVKIQSMIRAFVARKKISKQLQERGVMDHCELSQEEAALIIQKVYRGRTARKQRGPLINKEHGTLNEDTAEFIRYYANKWRRKSIFQVLLQYRAAKYQDLFNFSQQVHLYNQNAVHILHQFNMDVDFNLIDSKARANAWLGNKKPTVLKVPFRLDEIPYYDTSYMCDSDIGTSADLDEAWDAPFQWRDSVTTRSPLGPSSKDFKTESNIKLRSVPQHKQIDNRLPNVPFTRDPAASIKPLPAVAEPKSPLKTKKSSTGNTYSSSGNTYISSGNSYNSSETTINSSGNIYKSPANTYVAPKLPLTSTPKVITPKSHYEPKIPLSSEFMDKTNMLTTTPANKDFEFIKPTSVKPRPGPVNPINELHKLGRRGSTAEDEAPFNFQGMLRKTNYNRESLKRSVEAIGILKRTQSGFGCPEEVPERSVIYSRTNLKKVASVDINERKFAGEVAPGIYMEGIVVDL